MLKDDLPGLVSGTGLVCLVCPVSQSERLSSSEGGG